MDTREMIDALHADAGDALGWARRGRRRLVEQARAAGGPGLDERKGLVCVVVLLRDMVGDGGRRFGPVCLAAAAKLFRASRSSPGGRTARPLARWSTSAGAGGGRLLADLQCRPGDPVFAEMAADVRERWRRFRLHVEVEVGRESAASGPDGALFAEEITAVTGVTQLTDGGPGRGLTEAEALGMLQGQAWDTLPRARPPAAGSGPGRERPDAGRPGRGPNPTSWRAAEGGQGPRHYLRRSGARPFQWPATGTSVPRPAVDRPAELRGRVKGLLLEGKPVEAAEAEYARIVQDVEALAFRVDTLADATAGVKHAVERALAGLLDSTRAAIHAEAAEAAWRIAGETAAAAAGRLAELQGLYIVAGHFPAEPEVYRAWRGGTIHTPPVTDEFKELPG